MLDSRLAIQFLEGSRGSVSASHPNPNNPYYREKVKLHRLISSGTVLAETVLHKDDAREWLLEQMAQLGVAEVHQITTDEGVDYEEVS